MIIRRYYIDYTDEEFELRKKFENTVTYDDLRKYLYKFGNGLELYKYDHKVLDEDIFAGNPIVYLKNKTQMKYIKIGLDILAGVDKILEAKKEKGEGYFGKEIPGGHETRGLYFTETNFELISELEKKRCINEAKSFINYYFNSKRKAVNAIKPSTIKNNLFWRKHNKKLEEINNLITQHCTYRCGITPDKIDMLVPAENFKNTHYEITVSWKNFVQTKYNEKNNKAKLARII